MLTEKKIFDTLTEIMSYEGNFWPGFNNPDAFMIDARVNLLRSEGDDWAIVYENLEYVHMDGELRLHLTYYGNCVHGIKEGNYTSASPVNDNALEMIAPGDFLEYDAKQLLVREWGIPLSLNRADYLEAGIELIHEDEIMVHEAVRLLLPCYGQLFRATEDELYQRLPKDMEKVLVLDEWHYHSMHNHVLTDRKENVSERYGSSGVSREVDEACMKYIRDGFAKGHIKKVRWNTDDKCPQLLRDDETWQLFAKVLVTRDPLEYKPTLTPNTHWRNWPMSGFEYEIRQFMY